MVAAYAAGGDALFTAENFRKLHIKLSDEKCDADTTAVDMTQTERRLPWTGGYKVRIATFGNIHYRGGEGEDVIVRGAPDVIGHVKIRGDLIELDCNSFDHSDVDITLPGRAFNQVVLAGAGTITMENVKQPQLDLIIAGSGTVTAQGDVDRLEIKIAGSGNAKMGELKSRELEVNIAGSGDAEAAPSEEADIKIMGAGNIRLMTRPPRLKTKIMGSGRIIQAADQT